jgi:hypothetical protein
LTLNWAIGHQTGFEDILQRNFNRASTLKMTWPEWENWWMPSSGLSSGFQVQGSHWMTPNWNPEPGTLNLTLNWAIGHQNGFEDILQRSFNRASTLKMTWPGWENGGGSRSGLSLWLSSGFQVQDSHWMTPNRNPELNPEIDPELGHWSPKRF